MTREQKDLLLKDLCGRLPYGIKGNFLNSDGSLSHDPLLRKVSITYSCLVTADGNDGMVLNGDLKPYLFPLSSMTVEQRCKAQNLLPNKCEISFINSKITFYGEDCCEIKLEQFDKLFKFFDSQHVDYRGLIPMGLAIDATDQNIY